MRGRGGEGEVERGRENKPSREPARKKKNKSDTHDQGRPTKRRKRTSCEARVNIKPRVPKEGITQIMRGLRIDTPSSKTSKMGLASGGGLGKHGEEVEE